MDDSFPEMFGKKRQAHGYMLVQKPEKIVFSL